MPDLVAAKVSMFARYTTWIFWPRKQPQYLFRNFLDRIILDIVHSMTLHCIYSLICLSTMAMGKNLPIKIDKWINVHNYSWPIECTRSLIKRRILPIIFLTFLWFFYTDTRVRVRPHARTHTKILLVPTLLQN